MNTRSNRRHALAALCVSAFALVALVAPVATAQPEDDLSAIVIIQRVQSFYDKTKTFQAKFRQKYKIHAYDKTKRSEGTVTFRKPGRMSWRYTNGNRVVSDGKEIKVYERENAQMVVQPVDKSQYPAALSFLTGEGKLTKEFLLRKYKTKPGYWIIEGKPKQPTPAYKRIFLFVDKQTFHVRRVMLVDAQKNINRFDFVAAKVNVPVKKEEFEFEPPRGTKIVKP